MGSKVGVELSYLGEQCQRYVLDVCTELDCTPSYSQSWHLHRMYWDRMLDYDFIRMILSEEKPNQRETIKIPSDRITYRCFGFPKLIRETFDTEAEAKLRIAQIELEKEQGKFLPPAELVDLDSHPIANKETMTVAQLMEEYVRMYGLKHWEAETWVDNQHRINDYIPPHIGSLPLKMHTILNGKNA